MSIKHSLGINIYSSISISRGFSLNGGAFTENKGRKGEVTGTGDKKYRKKRDE